LHHSGGLGGKKQLFAEQKEKMTAQYQPESTNSTGNVLAPQQRRASRLTWAFYRLAEQRQQAGGD